MHFSAGETVTLRVVFHDWDEDSSNFGDPIDPDTVNVEVYFDSALIISDTATREDVGVYSYQFNPTDTGIFNASIIGHFSDGSTSVASMEIAVGVHVDQVHLDKAYEISFATDLEPLLVDPEEFQALYPEADLVEVASLIHRFSTEVRDIYMRTEDLPFVAYEYIRAAVECSLYRTYVFGGSMGSAESITLGDLSVSSKSYPTSVKGVNRATATTPCELAAVLRDEMVRGNANIKAVVSGKNFKNPMPKRRIRHAERF